MSADKYTILIIEDDFPIRRFLRSALVSANYHVIEAETGREGINLIIHKHPDLLILDLGLPDMDGMAVIRELRDWTNMPIVILSARGQEKDKVLALDAGADDYLTKPFSVDELLARIRVALRHFLRIATGERKGETIINIKNLKIDFDAHRIFRDDNEIHLTNIEYRLLTTMAKNVGKVLTHSFIIREVWGRMSYEENHPLSTSVSYRPDGYDELKGNAPAMQEVFHTLWLLRKQDLPVLIIGESGTGKELVARMIHRHSIRSDKLFVALNCAAFQDTLIESMLFGHVKGAFSGAVSNNQGFIQQAEGGTIFLDEVNHMSPSMQSKLLRVLQEGEYYPVGSTKVQRANIRIICAAKDNFPAMVKAGQFREDLFYRINVIEMKVPPLRERKEDIQLLAEHFIEASNKEHKTDVKGIRPMALQRLLEYPWPGNVRQLENSIRHACMFTKRNGWIDTSHLPQEIISTNQVDKEDKRSLSTQISEFERKIILQVLSQAQWNNSKAARILGISRPTLIKKISEYKLFEPV